MLGTREEVRAVAVFKYFTDEKHAVAFVKRGALLLRPLSHFKMLDDEGVRGDREEGTLTFQPEGGLQLTRVEDGTTLSIQGSFNSSASENDLFVFCASNQRSTELAEKFGSYCVEIEPDVLIGRLKARAHPSSQLDYDQIVAGKVDYRSPEMRPEADWALPERIALIKPQSFAWQDEFRIVVGNRGALAVENVAVTIQIGNRAEGSVASQNPIVVEIGNLQDFAVLHRL